MKIVCNNVRRNLIYGYELTDAQKKDFDYINAEEFDSHDFFTYKGVVYDPSEFVRIDNTIAPHCQREGWEKFDGYQSNSFFSGILFKYSANFESVIVATYFA